MNYLFTEVNRYVSSDDFYAKLGEQLQQRAGGDPKLCIGTIDIDHFNYINDLLGFEVGDLILQKEAEYFSTILQGEDYFTRLHADIFAFCVSFTSLDDAQKMFQQLCNWEFLAMGMLPSSYKLTISGGVFIVNEQPRSVSVLLDKANYARQRAKRNLDSEICFYNEQMNTELQWQKSVTTSMEAALNNHEFQMYLQPKISIKDEAVTGAEALVRWNHPRHGLITPNRFIPVMEQSGFVQKLDFFMLEEACHFLNGCSSDGIPQMPISVNFSKAHLSNENLVDQIFNTVKNAGVATQMIEIEFTESIFVEGFECLVGIINDLRQLGFKVSLDDFGSAYSSLNCLKELPIDIIKIDKGFLQDSSNTKKGKIIIAKVVEMMKSLSMYSIMEGVETPEQVEFLRELSCDYAQGYFYARPMPQAEYVAYLKDKRLACHNNEAVLQGAIDNEIIHRETASDNSELEWLRELQQSLTDKVDLVTNIPVGICRFLLDDSFTVVYANNAFYDLFGCTQEQFERDNSITKAFLQEEADTVRIQLQQDQRAGVASFRVENHIVKPDGEMIWVLASGSFDTYKGAPAARGVVVDITEQKEIEENLRINEERFRLALAQTDSTIFDYHIATKVMIHADKSAEKYGLTHETHNVPDYLVDNEIVHPDSAQDYLEMYRRIREGEATASCVIQTKTVTQCYIWQKITMTNIYDHNNVAVRAVGLLEDIDQQTRREAHLLEQSQRDPLTGLYNKGVTESQIRKLLCDENPSGALFIIDLDAFKEVNDRHGHQFGDLVLIESARRLVTLFRKADVIGRIGGDEFFVFLNGTHKQETILRKANELCVAFQKPFCDDYISQIVTCAVGIARCPANGESFDELYRKADISLYRAKDNGRNQYCLYCEGETDNR